MKLNNFHYHIKYQLRINPTVISDKALFTVVALSVFFYFTRMKCILYIMTKNLTVIQYPCVEEGYYSN